MKRPHCLYSQLLEKVIRHQPEQAVVLANKKERHGYMGHRTGRGVYVCVKLRSDRGREDFSMQENIDGTAANTDIYLTSVASTLRVCMCTVVYVYDKRKSLCVCVLRRSMKVRLNNIHTCTHCLCVLDVLVII